MRNPRVSLFIVCLFVSYNADLSVENLHYNPPTAHGSMFYCI